MQKHRPLFPGRIQGQSQGFLVLHDPEAAQRVRVSERVDRHGDGSRPLQAPGGNEFQQRLGGLGWQVVGQREKGILGRVSDVLDPVRGDANAQQVLGRQRAENLGWWRWGGRWRWRGDLLDPLPHFHDLDGAGARVRLDPASLGPGIGIVVVTDIGQEEARLGLVDDDADVAADAH